MGFLKKGFPSIAGPHTAFDKTYQHPVNKFMFSFSSMHGAAIIAIAREWVIFFNIKHGQQMQKHQWCVHIDGSPASAFWFIAHKKDYGSYKFIRRVSIIYYLIEASIIFASLLIFDESLITMTISTIFFVFEIVLIVILWLKIPNFYDTFGVQQELKYVLVLSIPLIGIQAGWSIVETIQPFDDDVYWIFLSIQNIVVCILTAIVCLVFNCYIFVGKYKYLLSENGNNVVATNQSDKLRLVDTLKDEQLIDQFMAHLSNEFSVELLLSFIEFKQFKQLMESDEDFMNEIDVETESLVNDTLCSKLPKSFIVFEAHNDKQVNVYKYLWIARDLFGKYVDYSSEFEINISYQQRRQITAFIHEMAYNDACILLNQAENLCRLYTLYDQACDTIYSLMSHSHLRFAKSNQTNILM